MNIEIASGTAFIGWHVPLGDRVRYLTRKEPAVTIPGAEVCIGDLSEPETLHGFVQGADVLYHCAAELRDAAAMEKTNVTGTANLLRAATGEIGRWVQLSSTGVYGAVRHGVVREDADIRPGNAYERSKAAADALVLAAADTQNLSCVLLRPSNVYGADMPNQSLFQLIRMIAKGLFFYIGPRGAMANYVHVENVVDALLACASATLPANGRAYIVSDHCPLEAFAGIIAAHLGKPAPRLRLPEMPVRALAVACGWLPGIPLKTSRIDALTNRTVYCTDRIEAELGFSNLLSMEAGLAELVR
ncbi:MAG: NAD-dependent epimerase/dehydratase family protein, partial [Gallionellaceae bacterium]|nr:NAD-dependent epimerase/dehydratase family protein [Gallionellaceae bacterium]